MNWLEHDTREQLGLGARLVVAAITLALLIAMQLTGGGGR
jgi:hypothetical protein